MKKKLLFLFFAVYALSPLLDSAELSITEAEFGRLVNLQVRSEEATEKLNKNYTEFQESLKIETKILHNFKRILNDSEKLLLSNELKLQSLKKNNQKELDILQSSKNELTNIEKSTENLRKFSITSQTGTILLTSTGFVVGFGLGFLLAIVVI